MVLNWWYFHTSAAPVRDPPCHEASLSVDNDEACILCYIRGKNFSFIEKAFPLGFALCPIMFLDTFICLCFPGACWSEAFSPCSDAGTLPHMPDRDFLSVSPQISRYDRKQLHP